MIYTFRFLTDSIFPPTKHELLLRKYNTLTFCDFYNIQTAFDTVFISNYHIPAIQAAIAACKFENNYNAAKLLSNLVQKYLESLPHKKTLLIPVPLSKQRLNERGFNQVSRVLEYVKSQNININVQTNLISRIKNTQPQTSLHKAERQKNIIGAFSVNLNYLKNLNDFERIIICDDVLTTGSTLNEVRSKIEPHLPPHIEVITLAWAH